ncbi:MAG: type II secretion system protein [Planctomycetes bacterium]|jgi:prepilin-type N-terminal cleavage/methylation domain-containing protein|nr:type II secretion system protein [Planctomycetota bacterium]
MEVLHERTAASARASRGAGFTLIELLAVLMILSILIAILVTQLRPAKEATQEGITRTLLGQIGAALGEFSDEHGGFPPSQLPSDLGAPPNGTNLGAECLYLALCAQGAPGYGVLDQTDKLSNTDNDSLSKRAKGFDSQELFEICDVWGNPIAYIQAADYDREFQYATVDRDGGPQESALRARKNPKTGRYQEPNGFQLVSAGLDGLFGTEDDLTNYKK